VNVPLSTGRLARPTIGLTLGEESSIGPEVMLAALDEAVRADCDVIIVVGRGLGQWASEQVADRHRGVGVRVVEADDGPEEPLVAAGQSTQRSRARAFAALKGLVDLAVGAQVHAIVTGPVPKGIFDGEVERPPGQTEYVAGRHGADAFAMMLAGPKLRVVPVTTHIAIADVAATLTTPMIVSTTTAANDDLQAHFGIAAPRIAVCGLNPHAGEGGRVGDEEARIIAPAVAALREAGVDASGPISADAVFGDALAGAWDVVVCMYHDQGLGPLKTVHARDAINFTCGLPVPRMSPDHGTAYEIAGRGIADATSARHAVSRAVAIALASSRAQANRQERGHAA